MDDLDKAIINRLQQDFPVCESPYSQVAQQLGVTETVLLERLKALLEQGVSTRFGPMYHAEKMGGGLTLAAIEAPEQRFDEVAAKVNAFVEVAHNYQRRHRLNMWFVLATERPEQIQEVLDEISRVTGLKVHNMPKIKEYFVGLRFDV